MKQQSSDMVNNIAIKIKHLNTEQSKKLNSNLRRHSSLLSERDEKLTFTNRVKGDIETTTSDPVDYRSYAYLRALKGEGEKEISKLLEDGIIRPSRPPYNSPV